MPTRAFKEFLKTSSIQPPFLLALSGGPDSICLWDLLLREKVPHHVAHVDHGWREESAQEALLLEKQAKALGIPFHLKKLIKAEKNLEEQARLERLAFFRFICEQEKLSGVLLAHHADDLAETVLKRLFEGAALEKLGGMQMESLFDGVTLLRPLLPVSKKQITAYNKKKQLSYFEDHTNEDERFLRARMRKQLLPLLSTHFGKEITTALAHLGKESFELREYLENEVCSLEYLIDQKDGVWLLDLSQVEMAPYLKKQLMKKFFQKAGLSQNRQVRERCLEAVLAHKLNWKLEWERCSIGVHKGLISAKKGYLQEQ